MIELNKIYNEDCLEGMKRIEDKSVDMILCDLPYGTTNNAWDVIIDTEKLFSEYKRICKQNTNVLLFCQQPFANLLMNSIYESEFSHQLIWIKKNTTRFMSTKNLPLSQYEMILCFRLNKYANKQQHKWLRDHFTNELGNSDYSVKELEKLIPNRSAGHWFRYSGDFRIPTEKNYKRLQEITKHFKTPYIDIRRKFIQEKTNLCTYNGNNERDILQFDRDKENYHPTQKPILLFEHLIKIYSNEGETVLDNCMGSGTTAISALNTNRNFIGFEMDKEYYELSNKRILIKAAEISDKMVAREASQDALKLT